MPLKYVDPNKKGGSMYRALAGFGRSRQVQWFAQHVSPRIDPWLYRATGGRLTTSLVTVINAPLVTKGAKSGQPRTVQLTYFHDGNDPILIASNYGGAKHPQWYHNLVANPACQFGYEDYVATEVTDPDEYARLYGLAEQIYPGYGDYRAMASATGRHIPVFRLKRPQ